MGARRVGRPAWQPALLPLLLPLLVVVMGCASACIVAPPIEPEEPEANKPPFIAEPDPDNPIVVLDTETTVVLSARLFDQNDEPQLYVAWITERSNQVAESVAVPTADGELFQGLFYPFETVSFSLLTCDEPLRNASSETVFLFVADRPLNVSSNAEVATVDDEGFIDSYAWSIDLRPGRCDQDGL